MMQQCRLLVAHLDLSRFQGLPTLHLDLHTRAAWRILSQGDSSDSSMGLTTFGRFRLVAAFLVRSLRSFLWRGRAIDFLLDLQHCPGGLRQLAVIVRHGARTAVALPHHRRITGAGERRSFFLQVSARASRAAHHGLLHMQLCEDPSGFLWISEL